MSTISRGVRRFPADVGSDAPNDRSPSVLVVGGGPVGITVALILARYGVTSIVLERRATPTPRDESRALTWMPRGIELLDWLGLRTAFEERATQRRYHDFVVGKRTVMTLDLGTVPSPFPHTLDLPQGDTEALLRDAALATQLVDVRSSHDVVDTRQTDDRVIADVVVDGTPATFSADWGIACDGYHSPTRARLGIATTKLDYGADSAVADVEMFDDVADGRSKIVLDPRRPWGYFPFQRDRARLIYRINAGESRQAMTTEDCVRALYASLVPSARVKRFLWSSAFRLEQLQSQTYRAGRWVLAGDAAHAMGPSAGAGLQLGVVGAWRLAWRLALIVRASADARLLDDYDREQHVAARQIQSDNETIFRNLALSNAFASLARATLLEAVGRIGAITRRAAAITTLEAQRVPVRDAFDVPREWPSVASSGGWVAGERAPLDFLGGSGASLTERGRSFRIVPFAGEGVLRANASSATFPFPVTVEAVAPAPVRGRAPAFALVRPDQTVAAIVP